MCLHYYRCVDCLTIGTAAEYKTRAVCGHCAGKLEYMGRVQGARIVKDREVCKCDGRCVFARGPSCDCACQGANHGSGWFGGGFEDVTTDVGPVPRLRMPAAAIAAAVAAEWRGGLAALVEASISADVRRDWMQRYKFAETISKARASRLHKNRMKLISDAMPDYRPPAIPTQAALF